MKGKTNGQRIYELVENSGMTVTDAARKLGLRPTPYYSHAKTHGLPLHSNKKAKRAKSSDPVTFVVPASDDKIIFLKCTPAQLETLREVLRG